MPKDTMEYTVKKPVTKVVLIDALIRCNLCGGYKPASQVGFRRMKDGTLRNQAQCKACR
jgi:Pyruvate/2-oxoacid:ferredoxin oxidoreductase delta subunit